MSKKPNACLLLYHMHLKDVCIYRNPKVPLNKSVWSLIQIIELFPSHFFGKVWLSFTGVVKHALSFPHTSYSFHLGLPNPSWAWVAQWEDYSSQGKDCSRRWSGTIISCLTFDLLLTHLIWKECFSVHWLLTYLKVTYLENCVLAFINLWISSNSLILKKWDWVCIDFLSVGRGLQWEEAVVAVANVGQLLTSCTSP